MYNQTITKDSLPQTIPSLAYGAKAAVYTRDHPFSNMHKDSFRRVLVFGGTVVAKNQMRGTWVYSWYDNSWFRLPLDLQPPERVWHSLTSICDNYVVLFGGDLNDKINFFDNISDTSPDPVSDTWIFNGVEETWENITPTPDKPSPSPRKSHSAAALNNAGSPCHCRESVMIYGGLRNRYADDELWELRCVNQKVLSLSFEWFRHRKQSGENWPPPSAFHFAMHADKGKTAMLVWGSGALSREGVLSGVFQSSWLYNMTFQRWSVFHTQREPEATNNSDTSIELHSTVVFYSALNLIIQISRVNIYFLNLKERRWTYLLLPRQYATTSFLTEHKAAVYVDSLVFLFSPSYGFGMRVWELRRIGIKWGLKLRDEKSLLVSKPVGLIGVWNRIGDDLIFFRPIATYWRYLRDIRNAKNLPVKQNRHNIMECDLTFWPSALLYDKLQVLSDVVKDGRTSILYESWHMDLQTATWWKYSTRMSAAAIQRTASSANWNDKRLVVYGGLSSAKQLLDQDNYMNFYTSDVWVYVLKHRQWFKVNTTGERPPGRVYSSLLYASRNAFLLCGGATMRLQHSDLTGNVSNLNINRSNILDGEELFNTLEARNDLWLLTLSDCKEDCTLTGFTGTWTELAIGKGDSSQKPVLTDRMGHSAVYVDNKMFVFGGFKVTDFKKRSCYDDIWSYDIQANSWKMTDGSTGHLKMSLSPLRMCKLPATVLRSRIVVGITPRSEPGKRRLFSYLKDSSTWVDHNISISLEVDYFFTWREWVIDFTHTKNGPVSIPECKGRYCITPRWKMIVSSLKLACQPGQFSSNWSSEVCSPCQAGYFAPKPRATSCIKCPTGLTTEDIGAISISNCSCDPRYCKHGGCLIINGGESTEAVCKCDFGYTGERCQFPMLLTIIFTSMAALVIIALIVRFVQKIRKYKEQKRADNVQLEDMNRAWTIDSSEIHLMHRLDLQSPGSYGDVYKAKYRDINVAVKKLKVEMREDFRVEREFEREIQVMKSIRHQNIVLFIGAGKFQEEEDCPFLVLEFMPGGALSSLLRNREVEYDTQQQISFCLDIARGLEFLHNLSPPRIHRDIKSNNLLLSEQLVVKVSDFGSARLVKARESMQRVQRSHGTPFQAAEDATTPLLNANSDLSRNVGAVLWRAPDVFLGESYGTAIDVYRLRAISNEIYKYEQIGLYTIILTTTTTINDVLDR